jgi:hypothetical protein
LHAAKLLDLGALRADSLILALYCFPLRVDLLLLRLERVSDQSSGRRTSDCSDCDAAAGVASLVANDSAKASAYRASRDGSDGSRLFRFRAPSHGECRYSGNNEYLG